MKNAMTERLPLSESAFCALEDAYEKQRQQAQHLHHLKAASTHSSSGAEEFSHSAGVAAAEMQRLLHETRQLHQRFIQIVNGTEPPFSEEECTRLTLLGFDVPPFPASDELLSKETCTAAASRTELRARSALYVSKAAAVKADNEMAGLRQENAQLLSSLAWYRLQESVTQQLNGKALLTASTTVGTPAPSQSSSAELLRRFKATKELAASLCSTPASSARAESASLFQTAVDVAIRELLQQQRFPPQVRVERVDGTCFYSLDRPVVITFAAPYSCTLVVQDPEGVEADCDLRAYLIHLYQPLLRALRWSPPARVNSAAGDVAVTDPDRCLLLPSLDASETTPLMQSATNGRRTGVLFGEGGAPVTASGDLCADISVAAASSLQLSSSTTPCEAQACHRPPPPCVGLEKLHSPSVSPSALSQMTYEELVALKRETLQRLDRAGAGTPM
jgi:hypothetical protein